MKNLKNTRSAFSGVSLGSWFLHLLQALAGLALMLLSVWFIAASAIAGVTGMALAFNYVIPSVLIRALAFTRIASGYFEKYLSHLGLLRSLADGRYTLFAQVLAGTKQTAGESEQTAERRAEQLQQASETWAAQWSSTLNPLSAGAVQLCGITAVFAVLLPQIILPWLALMLAVCVLVTISYLRARRLQAKAREAQLRFNRQFYQWAQSVSLWSQKPGWAEGAEVQAAASEFARARHRQELLNSQGEWWLLVMGVVWALFACWYWQGQELLSFDKTADAIWLIPLVAALTLRDWIVPANSAAISLAAVQQAREQMQMDLTAPDVMLAANKPAEIGSVQPGQRISLQLENFSWQREHAQGPVVTATLQTGELALLEGSSGCGKSSLLAAMCGLLPATGQISVNGQLIDSHSELVAAGLIHFGEQFAHIFSDSLANNLRMAKPDASDDECIAALNWAGLTEFANKDSLAIWLGEAGRPISGGERKRLILARAYLADAPVWLLDEPFEGLDQAMQNQLAVRLSEHAKQRLIVIASHTRPEQLGVGQVISMDAAEEITEQVGLAA